MSSLNKAIIIGNLGADPEVRYTASGMAVATFNVATKETWKDKNNSKQDRTEWHRVVAWGKLGEQAGEYLKKGRLVYVEGRMQTREYEGKDGIKRKTFEIVASMFRMLGPSGQQGDREGYKTQGSLQPSGDDDFIPEIEEGDVPL
ncbi:MAG: single-stranded DNA-binding protein [Syntrophorhabdus sp.]